MPDLNPLDFPSRRSSRTELSSSKSSASDSLLGMHISDFGLIQKLMVKQLLNNDYSFREHLLLWGDADARESEEHMSVTTLRSLRNMLMKDAKRSRFVLRGDEENHDGTRRVSSSLTFSKQHMGRGNPLGIGVAGVPENETTGGRDSGASSSDGADDTLEASSLEQLRAQVWDFMENPSSSLAAYIISISILLLILLCSITFCLETVESLSHARPAFHIIEVVSVICFTVEYVIRLFTCPELFPFLRAPLNVIDLIAILPFYIELLGKGVGLGSTQVLRVIRLVRVFRVLKLGSKSGRLDVIINAVAASTDMLVMLTFLLLLSMIVFSSLIYFAEKNTYNESSGQYSFKSIPDAFWWCMVTLMTVGYGDAVPETPIGRLIATATMLSSIIILALPISVIGTNFTSQWIVFKEQFKTKDRARIMAKRFSRSRRLICAYRMSLDDIIKELGRASRRIEEKCQNVRVHLEKASSLFKMADERGQAVHYAETPRASDDSLRSDRVSDDSPDSPVRRSSPLGAGAEAPMTVRKDERADGAQKNMEASQRDDAGLQEEKKESGEERGLVNGEGSNGESDKEGGGTESENTRAFEDNGNGSADRSSSAAVAALPEVSGELDAMPSRREEQRILDRHMAELTPQAAPPTSPLRPPRLTVPPSDSEEPRTPTRQSSFSIRLDRLVQAHEELLESIRDLDNTMTIYEELVNIAEALTAQKGIVTLEFCLQKHKRLGKSMDEVDMVESAVEDMFEEYDYFLVQLNV